MQFCVPNSISWSIIDDCNLRCKHCYSFKKDICNNIMSKDKVFEAINILKGYEIFRITLTGGEPLLRSDIYEIIEELKFYGFTVEINTNGTLINNCNAKLLKSLEVDSVRISLDGSNKLTHDAFRGGEGVFDKAIKSIDILNNEGINTTVATVPNKFNKNEIGDIAKLISQLGVNEWHLFRLIITGNTIYNKNIILSKEEYFNVMMTVKELITIYNDIKINFNDPLFNFFNEEKNTFGCGAGKVYISLDTRGDLHLCPSNPHIVGNLFKDNLRDVWNKKLICKIRNNSLIYECSKCEFKKVCGGCCASSFSKFNNEYINDPYCIKEYLK